MTKDKQDTTTDEATQLVEKVRQAVSDVEEPEQGGDVTRADVERLRQDPALLRVAEIAEIYASH